jgi:replication-associated recombination protein RarA
MILDEKRRALGLKVAARRSPHMAFLGNPGTGKTMVARILGKLLHMVGVLPSDKVTEVQRTDLVGEFVGHTGPKTRKKIKEAEGGILFVDEAYRLIPMQKADDKDYGLEALEEIMSIMDSGKVVVIFAGYAEPMKRVLAPMRDFVEE